MLRVFFICITLCLFLGPEGNTQKAHPRRVVRVAAVVARVEVNATQRNATTSRNLDLAGLNTGRSSSAEDGGGEGGLLFQRGSGTSVSSDLFIFIASPTLKSSQAHGSRHHLFFSSPEKKEKRNRRGRFYHLSADVGRVLRQSH